MNLTEHFTLEEFTFSSAGVRAGIDNTPPQEIAEVLKQTANKMEIVRAKLESLPITVDSAYRCQEVNKLVGGATNSAHMGGWAVDFVCPAFGSPKEIAQFLAKDPTLTFDQLIWEGSWVHIAFGPLLRREVLTAHFSKGGVTYTRGITE